MDPRLVIVMRKKESTRGEGMGPLRAASSIELGGRDRTVKEQPLRWDFWEGGKHRSTRALCRSKEDFKRNN